MNPTVSQTLFHFTGMDHARGRLKSPEDGFATLKMIIQSQKFIFGINKRVFKVYRDPKDRGFDFDFEIPMACFTETPQQYLGQHLAAFGEFGLGMKLDWGICNGAQNVIYCDYTHNNNYLQGLYKAVIFATDGLSSFKDGRGEAVGALVAATESMAFRNEREWRFIGRVISGRVVPPAAVTFDSANIEMIVCPRDFVGQLEQFLATLPHYNLRAFSIVTTEDLY